MAINTSMTNGRQFSFSLEQGRLKNVCDDLISLQNSMMPSKAAAAQIKEEIDLYRSILTGGPGATTAQVYMIRELTASNVQGTPGWEYDPLLHFSISELTATANRFSTPNRFYYEAVTSVPVKAAPKLRPQVNTALLKHTPVHPIRSDRLATYADISESARWNCGEEKGLTVLENAGYRALSEFRVLGERVNDYALITRVYVAAEPFLPELARNIFDNLVLYARDLLPRREKKDVYEIAKQATHPGCALNRRALKETARPR